MRRLRADRAVRSAPARVAGGLALTAAALLLVGAPARADGPLQVVSVTAADSRVSVVADVPSPASVTDPPPTFEVLDGPTPLPVEAAPVLDPRRTATLVVDAGATAAPAGLADLQRAATDLVLRVGSAVPLALVASRGAAPVLLEPQGVAAAAAALSGLRPGTGDEAGLAPAVRAAGERGRTAAAVPHVVVVVAAGEADVPAADLGRELAGSRALVYAIAPGGAGVDYWREVTAFSGGAVEPAGGRAAGRLAAQLGRQHVVGFPEPRTDGSVRLLARTPAGTLTADVSLAAASRDGSTPGQRRNAGRWVMATATLLLVLVVVGHLLELGAARRRRGRAGASGRSGGPVLTGAHSREDAAARTRRGAPASVGAVGAHRRSGSAHSAGGRRGSGAGPGVDPAPRAAVPGGPRTGEPRAVDAPADDSHHPRVAAGPERPPESPGERVATAAPACTPGTGVHVLGEGALNGVTFPVVPHGLPSVNGYDPTPAAQPAPPVARHAARDDDSAPSSAEFERPATGTVEVPLQRDSTPPPPASAPPT